MGTETETETGAYNQEVLVDVHNNLTNYCILYFVGV